MKRTSSCFAVMALAVSLFACGSGQRVPSAMPLTQASVATPASATPTTGASSAELDLGAVAPLSFNRGACSFSVEPAPAYQMATDLRTVAEQLNRDDWGAQLPEGEAALRERVCLTSGCEGDIAPIALSLGDEATPAAFRVGMLVRSGTTLRAYGPFDGGFQLYHCVPAVSGEVREPAFDGALLAATLEIAQPTSVGVGENGPCEPGIEPSCQRACLDETATRLDLFVQRDSGQALLVTQTQRFDNSDTSQVQPKPAFEPVLDVARSELHFEACGERVTLRLVR